MIPRPGGLLQRLIEARAQRLAQNYFNPTDFRNEPGSPAGPQPWGQPWGELVPGAGGGNFPKAYPQTRAMGPSRFHRDENFSRPHPEPQPIPLEKVNYKLGIKTY
jgi:hypothetical protein